jgi:hypothetical protein
MLSLTRLRLGAGAALPNARTASCVRFASKMRSYAKRFARMLAGTGTALGTYAVLVTVAKSRRPTVACAASVARGGCIGPRKPALG